MESPVPHVVNTSSDTRRAISGGGCYECFDNRPTTLICKGERVPTFNKLEIGCSAIVVTSRTRSPTGRAWLAAGRHPYRIYSRSVRGSLKDAFQFWANWFIAYLSNKT
jgi:hypothetical protein